MSDEVKPVAAAGDAAGFRPRILLVDDCEDMRLYLRRVLELHSCEIAEASSGEEALSRAAVFAPELVLLDMTMPGGIDGLEVCRRLRTACTEGIPPAVVLASARGNVADVDAARDSGAHGYLVKPCSPAQVIGLIDNLELYLLRPECGFPHVWPYG